jgi:TonB-linked SusC/RagA family outer membrane protein
MNKTLIFLLLFCTQALWSQKIQVEGIITDYLTGDPLTGVTVAEKGLSNGVSTDINGFFAIRVSDENAILTFAIIGFITREVKVGANRRIDLALTDASLNLNETVVTALGLERQSKDLGYAVQRLHQEDIATVKSVNFTDDLAGKVAGVTITQGPTGVGSSSKIVIRGEASFSNNNPLFVVDGIPVNNNSLFNNSSEAAAGFQEVDFGNGAMDLNADDIASVTVLKGPTAAALYGTRAANGVIIISTKDGSMEKGLGLQFNSSTFFDQPFKLPEFQNQYGQGNSGKFAFKDGLGGGINDNISYSWGPELNKGILAAQYDSPVTLPNGQIVRGGDVAVHGGAAITPTEMVVYPNNLKDFYGTGTTLMNNIAISSGFDKGNFRLSMTDLRSNSFIPGVNLDRKTLATRLNFAPIDRLKITATANYINTQSDNRPSNGYGSENTNYAIVAWGPRSLDILRMKDYWQPGLENIQQYSFNYTFFDNPYFTLLENRNSLNRNRLIGNVMARYGLTEHLSISLRSGMDYSNERRQFRRHFSTNRFKNGGYAEQGVYFKEINTDFLLNYSRELGHFAVDVSAGGNRMDQYGTNIQTQTTALAQPGVFNLGNAATPLEVVAYDGRKRINSFYGSAKIGFKNYLFVDITGRNDWSSALATPISTANTSFFYPSVSGSFIVSNVMHLPRSVSFAKVRASAAKVGNDTEPFQTAGVFTPAVPFGGQPTFSAQNFIANANLLPESIFSWEIGADIRFFDDRLRFDVAYYDSRTENQIISLPIAVSSGYRQQVFNGGAVRSRGLEATVGITPLRRKHFQWNTVLNFSHNVATVEELPEGIQRLTLAYNRVYDNVNQTAWVLVEEGGRIGDLYGTGYLKNAKEEYVINANGGYIVDNTLKKLGNYNPDFILGMNNSFRYHNWNLGFLLDWRQGGIIISRTLALAAVGGQLKETANRPAEGIIAEGVVNTGTTDNPLYTPNTKAISAENYYRQYYDRNHEEHNTYDASYLKIREFSLGYTFKFKQSRQLNIALIGRNLFAFSEIPHFDPEQFSVQGQKFVSGVEDMSYPSARSIGVKLGIGF